jgi:hypothetical protein
MSLTVLLAMLQWMAPNDHREPWCNQLTSFWMSRNTVPLFQLNKKLPRPSKEFNEWITKTHLPSLIRLRNFDVIFGLGSFADRASTSRNHLVHPNWTSFRPKKSSEIQKFKTQQIHSYLVPIGCHVVSSKFKSSCFVVIGQLWNFAHLSSNNELASFKHIPNCHLWNIQLEFLLDCRQRLGWIW